MSEGVIIIRPSFMKICHDGCRSALFNHILYWIAKKSKDQSPEAMQSGETTYYATTDELTEQMAGAWGSKTVRLGVNALVDLGIIGRGKNPKWGADRTKHFFFGEEQYAKLVELCKKHQICIAHIGLPKEMISLLAAFGKSIECPCTGQMVNLPNANGKFTGAITKVTTKVSKTKVTERKNGTSQQKPNKVKGHESSHSINHSSLSSSQNSFSQEAKPEEVVFSQEAKQVYEFAAKLHLTYLKRDEKHRDNCVLLAEAGVTTLEKLESLMHYCGQIPFLAGKSLNLKNLVNELPGWLQTQRPPASAKPRSADDPIVKYRAIAAQFMPQAGVARSSYDDDDYVDDTFYGPKISDAQIAEKIADFSARYGDTNVEENHRKAVELQRELGISREKLYDCLFDAQVIADHKGKTMPIFFEELKLIVAERKAQALAS